MKANVIFCIILLGCTSLTACSDDDNSNNDVQVVGKFYNNLDDCYKDYDKDTCNKVYKMASDDVIKSQKHYTDIDECQDVYGIGGCANINTPLIPTSDEYKDDVFVPLLSGFSVVESYEDEEDDEGNTTNVKTYGYSSYTPQPYVFFYGYHRPMVISGGYGYTPRSYSLPVYTTKIDNHVFATTAKNFKGGFVRPNINEVKATITRTGFGTRAFSVSRNSSLSISRGGFGSKAATFGGGRGG